MRTTWVLWAALTGCGEVHEAAPAAADSSGSGDEQGSSSTTGAHGEASTDTGSDTNGGSEDESSESSTTEATVDAPRVDVAPGPVTDAELVETLAIARTEANATRRVVLQLDPSQLPTLQTGDRLLAAAEVQVTTRCDVGQTAPGCDYDPQVAAQLVLVGDDEDETPLSEVQTQTCTKAEHHCMLVFRPSEATVVLDDALHACIAAERCHVNLVMWAWDAQARAGGVDELIVGESEGDYLANQVVGGDKARIMVVRERGELGAGAEASETTAEGSLQVPTDASATLVYSHALGPVRAGEQFLIEARFSTSVSSRARVSSLVFVATDPAATESAGLESIAPKAIGEHNGINCTAGQSPCTTRKVAVLRVTEDVDAPLFVNVVVKSAVPGGGSANVQVQRDAGWIRATRYAAELGG